MNFSVKGLKPEHRQFCDDLREKHGWENDRLVLEHLIESFQANQGKKAASSSKPVSKPADEHTITAKMSPRDKELVEFIVAENFKRHQTEDMPSIIRRLFRQEKEVMEQKKHVLALPPGINAKILKDYNRLFQRGKVKRVGDLLTAQIKYSYQYRKWS